MSLNIFYGTPKSDASSEILRQVSYNSGLLIVPETYTLEAEKKIASISGIVGLGGADVQSFKRMAHQYLDRGPLGVPSVNSCGKNMAISLICQKYKNSLKAFKGSSSRPGFSESVLNLIKELKRYCVTPKDIINASEKTDRKILSSKLYDIGFIYEKYSEFISSGYHDSDDDLENFCSYIESSNIFSKKNIYIDKFSSFTPLEYKIVELMLAQCDSLTVSLPCLPDSLEFQFMSAQNTASRLKESASNLGVSVSEKIYNESLENPELYHLTSNFFSFTPEIFEGEIQNLSLYASKSIRGEVENVARTIREYVRSEKYNYSDISLIVRNTESYSSYVKSVFSSFDIPFSDTEPSKISNHPLSVFLLSAIDTVLSNYSYSSLFRYLKSGFSGINQEDIDLLENYMLSCGIYGSQFASDEKWRFKSGVLSKTSKKDESTFDKVDEIRKNVLPPLLSLKEKLSGKITALEFAGAVYSFIEESGLGERTIFVCKEYEKNGLNDESLVLLDTYNGLISALDALVASNTSEKLSASTFLSIFSEGISSINSHIIPSSVECVNFLSASRARGTTSPVVFIMGLNDRVFPKIPDNDGILTDSDRLHLSEMKISLAPSKEFLGYEEMSLLYNALSVAKEKLHLSYSIKNADGGGIMPSSAVKKVLELFPKLTEKAEGIGFTADELISAPIPTLSHMLNALNRYSYGEEIDENWFKIYDWFLNHKEYFLPRIPNSFSAITETNSLSKEITDKLFYDGFKSSISKLETYASCPFKYYMSYILKAKERKLAEFSPADIGSILHYYSESISNYIAYSETSWSDVTQDEITKVLKKCSQEIIDDGSYYLKNSKRALYLLKRLEALSFKMILLIQKHFISGSFEPLGSEIEFDENNEFGNIIIKSPKGDVHLTGKVDRADILHFPDGDYIRIIDYKSGNKSFSFSDIYYGFNLQLSVYMLALTEGKNCKPAGMLYFKLDDPIVNGNAKTLSEIEQERTNSLRMKGLLLSEKDVINASGIPEDSISDDSLTVKNEYINASLATLDNFSSLFARVKKIISALVEEMRSGNIKIKPSSTEDSPCEYCSYKNTCSGNERLTLLPKIDKIPWASFDESRNEDKKGGISK